MLYCEQRYAVVEAFEICCCVIWHPQLLTTQYYDPTSHMLFVVLDNTKLADNNERDVVSSYRCICTGSVWTKNIILRCMCEKFSILQYDAMMTTDDDDSMDFLMIGNGQKRTQSDLWRTKSYEYVRIVGRKKWQKAGKEMIIEISRETEAGNFDVIIAACCQTSICPRTSGTRTLPVEEKRNQRCTLFYLYSLSIYRQLTLTTMAAVNTKAKPYYTEEKAVHLIRVFLAVLSIMILLGWQHIILLNPLKRGKADMVRWILSTNELLKTCTPFSSLTLPLFAALKEHMDPSEIAATPFQIANVASFTMFPVVVMLIFWLAKAPQHFSKNMLTLLKLSLTTYALLALCGDNMTKHWKHSILSAIYIGALLTSTSNGKTSKNIMEEMPFTDFSDLLASSRLYGMLLFSIPFQVLSVLDRGVQIQRWPLPILLGG